MVFKCCVPGCRSYNPQVQIHIFPNKEPLYNVWIDQIGRADLLKLPMDKVRKSYRVCNIHFGPEAEYPGSRNKSKIRADAVPTLHLKRTLGQSISITVDLQASPSDSLTKTFKSELSTFQEFVSIPRTPSLVVEKCRLKEEEITTLAKISNGSSLENFVINGTKCIGVAANYRSLLKILNRPEPEVPDFFIKPVSSYITEGQKIVIPKGFSVNEEIELGIVIGKQCKKVSECKAMGFVGGYCLALDMTATCKLGIARKTGGSWTLGKGFDTACPLSKFILKSDIPDPHNIQLWCNVNGQERQKADTSDLLFNIPFLISYISSFITLEPNDVIITGSPPGMGPVKKGDIIEGGITGGISFKFEVDAD